MALTRWRTLAVLAALGAGVGVTFPASAGPDPSPAPRAKTAAAGLPVTVKNGASDPVPVAPQGTTNVTGTVTVGNFPAPTPTPLWQGAPYVATAPLPEFTGCMPLDIPTGKALFVTRVTADYQVPEGANGRNYWLDMTFGGGFTDAQLFIPSFPTGPRLSGDGYHGSLDVGVPVTDLRACGAEGFVTVLGYLVPVDGAQ